MKTFVATDIRIATKDGRYFAMGQHYYILKRYYETFGPMKLCCRVVKDKDEKLDYLDITDWLDQVIPVPSLAKVIIGREDKNLAKEMQDCDLLICRCPSFVANRAAGCARKMGKPYFAESMGCAWDALWNHGIAGKIIAPYMFLKMRSTVRHADYALYVTNEFLQKRYPCKNESIGASNVLIKSIDEAVLQKKLEKIAQTDYRSVTLMTTAAIDVWYKGQEFVIRAIPELNKAGIRVRYLLVGGGDAAYLKGIAKACGVEDQVEFVGRRPLAEVFALLDQADIYIQPSLQEGLPRSVIEAMSRACPVIGAKTAGIPELIAPECVVKRKSVSGIADAVKRITNVEKMTELAKQNFVHSKEYLDDVLNARREEYFARIKSQLAEGEAVQSGHDAIKEKSIV